MEIKKLNLVSFGQFKEKSLSFERQRINVIMGANEAGKSTLFEALKTILSGYSPASRERFPYVPWGEDHASIRAILWDGTEITRTLRSSVSGERVSQERVKKIQNHPLFGLERPIVDNLYTITAEDLSGIDKKSMDRVFEELMTTLDEEGLRTPPEAMKAMDEQLKALYSNRRNSVRRINLLDRQLEEVEIRLQEIATNEEIYLQDERLLQELGNELEAIEEELSCCERDYRLALDQESKLSVFSEDSWHEKELSRTLGKPHLDQLRVAERELDQIREQYRRLKEQLEKRREGMIPLSSADELSVLEEHLRALKAHESSLENYDQEIRRHKERLEAIEERFMDRFKKPISDSYKRPRNLSWLFLALVLALGLLFGLNLFNRIFLGVLACLSLAALMLSLWYNALQKGLFTRAVELRGEHNELQERLDALKESYGEEERSYEKRLARSGAKDPADLEERVYRYKVQKRRALEEQMQLQEDQEILIAVEEKLRSSLERHEELIRPLRTYHEDPELALGYLAEDLQRLELLEQLKEEVNESLSSEVIGARREELLARRQENLEKAHRATERMKRTLSEESSESIGDDKRLLIHKKKEKVLHYNRLLLLKGYLEDSYKRFIDEHQPMLLKQASGYLKEFTGGRYVDLLSSEPGELLLRKDNAEILPLRESHSKGTRNQVYLALRLAMIKSMETEETIPLFLDEAFSNWDHERLKGTLKSLAEVAKERQIFIFTCHEEILHQLETYTDCSVQRL